MTGSTFLRPCWPGVRRPVVVVAAVGGALALAGCGSSSSGTSASSSAPATAPSTAAAPTAAVSKAAAPAATAAPAASESAPSVASSVVATETEFSIKLSRQTFAAGSYTFKATNAGKIPHALTIDGPGVNNLSTADISPGQTATLKVTLAAGSYDVFCPVGNHKMLGMDLHITVG